MEEKNIMAFKDMEGNKIEFEVVAEIYLNEETENEKKYLLLSPLEDGKEDDMFAFRVDITEVGEEFNIVEDDAEFNEVKKAYKDLLY
ncbi:MAG: DUF1292 domain-containing protein [Sarcina sp.]